MEAPYILHMLSPLKHVSPFDVNMALDAGFTTVVPYTAVELGEVAGLTQDAIFSRGPKGARRTGIFIGGKNAILALDMLAAARKAMFPPFQVSVFADPAGSFTTAAAMVAKVEKALKAHGAGLSECRVAVFGATGVVGFSAAVIAAAEGAKTVLIGYDGAERVKALAEGAKGRFKVDLAYADGSSEALKEQAIKDVDVILAAGRAGVQIVSAPQLAKAPNLKVAADVNAVPPAGIEGLGAQDDGVALKGGRGVGIGSLAIGGIKYKVEAGLFRKMIESETPVCLDFRDAFARARELVG
ncbi:MAG TPA: NAD(P)-dependent methylenetetrahydromethanopterin dehydrogenase [Candidatus Angelobacter sp.]|nr:NAD(P)-dependent methylenetetrahydromethanopterin dehydrogenase [Candidatus Angelobacter sp.]